MRTPLIMENIGRPIRPAQFGSSSRIGLPLEHPHLLHKARLRTRGRVISDTLIALLRYVADEYANEIVAHVQFLNCYLSEENVKDGDVIGGKPSKHALGVTPVAWRGQKISVAVFPYRVWLLQRIQDEFDGLTPAQRADVASMLADTYLLPLVETRLNRRIERRDNCEVCGEAW